MEPSIAERCEAKVCRMKGLRKSPSISAIVVIRQI